MHSLIAPRVGTVAAAEYGGSSSEDMYAGSTAEDAARAASAETRAESFRRSYIDCCGGDSSLGRCMHSGSPCLQNYLPPAKCTSVRAPQCQSASEQFPVGRVFGGTPRTFGCSDCPSCCSAMEYATSADSWEGSRYRRQTCWMSSEAVSAGGKAWARLKNPALIEER